MPRQPAWTLVELLAVVGIVALLAGLLLPAVQKVREAANRARCLNHLHMTGLAVHHYHDARDYLPPSRWDCLAGTWYNALLPYLEQDNGAALWVAGRDYHSQSDAVRGVSAAVMRCPSRPGRGQSVSGDSRGPVPHRAGATGDYAAAIGDGSFRRLDHSPPHAYLLGYLPGNGPGIHAYGGPCPGRAWVSFESLTRGLSNTLLIGEKAILGAPGEAPDNCIYNPDHFDTVGRFAGPRYPLGAHFGGPHPGVCLFALADGSARALAVTTDAAELGRMAVRE